MEVLRLNTYVWNDEEGEVGRAMPNVRSAAGEMDLSVVESVE